MRLLILGSAFILLSCGQNPSGEKKEKVKTDTVKVSADTVKAIVKDQMPVYTSPGEGNVNQAMKARYGNKWHVLNDQEAQWMKDAMSLK